MFYYVTFDDYKTPTEGNSFQTCAEAIAYGRENLKPTMHDFSVFTPFGYTAEYSEDKYGRVFNKNNGTWSKP